MNLTGKVDMRTGSEHRMKVEVTDGGTRALTYLDDVLIDNRTGDFSYGLVGVRQDKGETDGQPEIALFDDFKVTSSTGKVLFEEDFSTSSPAMEGGEVIDGRLRVVGSTTRSIYAWQKEASDLHYTIEADMTLMADNAGIVFASTGPRTYLM